MIKTITKKLLIIFLLVLVFFQSSLNIKVFASTTPSVTVDNQSNNSYKITVNFSQNIPAGDIIDVELNNSSNQKVWQAYTNNGGNNYSVTTDTLTPGQYTVNVGLFTPNWSSNYAWNSNLYTINVSNDNSTNLTNSANSKPTINVTKNLDNSFQISLSFAQNIPSGNIIDLELYNNTGQKIWQKYTIQGGNNYLANTDILGAGIYNISVGLFTQNWSSNYAWYSNLYSINSTTVSSTVQPTPTISSFASQTTTQVTNNQALNAANSAYASWKSNYVQAAGNGFRVVRPENNNDTVSEGIGYGMLLSYFANDLTTFSGLWSYAQYYLDSKGLMNWQISSTGSVIGQGSATDADEDMAYALVRAESKWPGKGFGQSAKKLISSMLATEVLSNNLINPGDNWGNTTIMNPSYLAPAYYRTFASFNSDPRWTVIANANLSWMQNAINQNTGLVPDWLNSDYSLPSISWDKYPNSFYYDAVRTPIRLLMDLKWNNSQGAANILSKENNFITGIGINNLESGYTLSGTPLTTYLDSTFLSAYASMAQVNSTNNMAASSLNALINNTANGYFGTSLRALALYVIGGAN